MVKLKIYIGFKTNKKPEIFESQEKPTKGTHTKYDFTHGPFESLDKAQKYLNAIGDSACGEVNLSFLITKLQFLCNNIGGSICTQ